MKIRTLLMLLLLPIGQLAAQPNLQIAAYTSPSLGVWTPWAAAGNFGAISSPPTAAALYCQADASSSWAPCNPATMGMTWPSGSAGIPNYNGSSAWGTSYNASNPIPNTFLPLTLQNLTLATTQSANDNSTKLATTAYADRLIAGTLSGSFTTVAVGTALSVGAGSNVTSTGPGGAMASGAFTTTGTIATQNANAVNITGGIESNVVYSNGVTKYIPDDASTVSHVVFSPSGLVDTYAPYWTYPLAPAIVPATPGVKAMSATRTLVGVFSDSNYFTQGSAGAGLAAPNSAFTFCVSYQITSVANSPFLLSNISNGDSKGWEYGISGGGGFLATNAYANHIVTTNSYRTAGQEQIACGGMTGTGTATAYLQLNGGPVATGSQPYAKSASAVSTVGRYGNATGQSFNGTIDEWWVSSDVPSPYSLVSLWQNAMAQAGAGNRFPDTATTLIHCNGRTFNGTTWTCPQATLTTAGTVPSSTAASNVIPTNVAHYGTIEGSQPLGVQAQETYWYLPAAHNVLDFSGDFSSCAIIQPTTADIAGTAPYLQDGAAQGVNGWQLANESGATKFYGKTGTVSGAQLTANQLNVVCVGKAGANLLMKVNDQPTLYAAGTVVPFGGDFNLGMHWDWNTALQGTVYEVWSSTTTPTDALFTRIINGVLLAP